MPSRILLVRTDRIGDTLLTLPAVTALRQTFPDAFIAFLCQPYTEPMVRRINGLDQVLTYENEGKHQGFQGLELLSKELRSYQFDFSVVFFSSCFIDLGALAVWNSKAYRDRLPVVFLSFNRSGDGTSKRMSQT